MGRVAQTHTGSIVPANDGKEAARLKTIAQLFRNSYRLFWNDKIAVILTFVVPLVLMTIFGSIFGGGGVGPQGIRLAVLNQSPSPVAHSIEASLDTSKSFRIIKSYKG